MRTNTVILSMVAVLVFCLMPIVQAQSDNDKVTAREVKKETKELITSLQQLTAMGSVHAVWIIAKR
ncbi:MAG: hypothetical protein R6V54_11400 [Desulfobacteraceae bacterium]